MLSFASPCVLPLVPGYLSFVSGVALDELRSNVPAASRSQRRTVIVSSLAFILGFSVVFITLGASATALGQMISDRVMLLSRAAGVVIILLGLHTAGVLPLGWLHREWRFYPVRPSGIGGALLVGVAFAFGWSPCIGPILAVILALAGTQETAGDGVRLLWIYSAGLGVPFFASALAVDRLIAVIGRLRRFLHALEIASGLLLVAIGILISTDRLTLIAQFLTGYLPTY